MSAFVVSHDHIDALLTWAVDHKVTYWNKLDGVHVEITKWNATEIGQVLLAENERSVEHRYPSGDLPGTEGETFDAYTFRRFDEPGILTPVSMFKALACFDYQACETDDYEGSLAWRIINAIRSNVVYALPGWDDSPGWNFERKRRPTTRRPDVVLGVAAVRRQGRLL